MGNKAKKKKLGYLQGSQTDDHEKKNMNDESQYLTILNGIVIDVADLTKQDKALLLLLISSDIFYMQIK